jgi:hypothetical protein
VGHNTNQDARWLVGQPQPQLVPDVTQLRARARSAQQGQPAGHTDQPEHGGAGGQPPADGCRRRTDQRQHGGQKKNNEDDDGEEFELVPSRFGTRDIGSVGLHTDSLLADSDNPVRAVATLRIGVPVFPARTVRAGRTHRELSVLASTVPTCG